MLQIALIADESHYLKNNSSQRTKTIVPLLRQAKRAVLLSGTPALARPAELYPQLSAILHHSPATDSASTGKLRKARTSPDFSAFPWSWTRYAKHFCNAKYDRFGHWDTSGASNLDELYHSLSGVMLRRLKKDVLSQLPAKRRQRVVFELPAAPVKEIQKLMSELASCRTEFEQNSVPPW